jgi:phosphoribosyl 1,2-cyclic phosphodiesterase
VKVRFFGTRGSCPVSSNRHQRYGGNTSCVLVEVDGEPPLILDLGTGLRALGEALEPALRESGRPLVANALLSHLHYDHILGLPFFSPIRVPGAALDVYGPTQEEGTLHQVLSRAVQPPFFPITVQDFRGDLRFHDVDGADDLAFGGIKVKVRTVPHRGHTLGFRVEADGQSVAYLPDHQAPLDGRTVDEGVLELCDSADLVIHDAQYSDGEFAAKSDWGHSTEGFAVRVASEAGAKRLALFHHDPAHHDDDVDRLLARARELGGQLGLQDVTAAAEGSTVDLTLV